MSNQRKPMKKMNIVVLFGGQSSEHEVSCVSALKIINSIDEEIYNVLPVGITKEGKWLLYRGGIHNLNNENWEKDSRPAIISPDATDKCLMVFENEEKISKIKIDVVFPALHGLYGEDGTIQGLLELAQIPYVGCGILTSSVGMDKWYTKIIVDELGIKQAKSIGVFKDELNNPDEVINKIESKFSYPVFIKPSNAGSSVGISKAYDKEQLINGLNQAAIHDRKILIEEFIQGREIECAVLGGKSVEASGIGEILSNADFYDYDAKYNDDNSKTVINPDVDDSIVCEIKEDAKKIFKALDGWGLARVDFFLKMPEKKVIFNEINTMPGFTSISMYPMLWEKQGISNKQLVKTLIDLAIERSK